MCLSAIIFGEARGESDIGKVATAYSAINRKADPNYPKDICSIMKQPYQYEFIKKKGIPDKRQIAYLMPLAQAILDGKVDDPTQGKKHFYRFDLPTPRWAVGKPKQRIGNHIFVDV
jgi:spore germination cell wall hydrolase CwlJ-like protein